MPEPAKLIVTVLSVQAETFPAGIVCVPIFTVPFDAPKFDASVIENDAGAYAAPLDANGDDAHKPL